MTLPLRSVPALLLSVSFSLLACGPTAEEEPGPNTPDDPEVELCTVLPASAVDPLLAPIADGRSIATVRPGIKSCTYRIEPVGQLPAVGVLVDYTYHSSSDNARASIESAHENAVRAGLTNIDWLEGFGDRAFISEQGAAVGIKLARGRLAMQVNVNRPDAGFDALAPVVRALTTRALEELPARE